jgi:hypothetical protein
MRSSIPYGIRICRRRKGPSIYMKNHFSILFQGQIYTVQQIADKLGFSRQRVYAKYRKHRLEPEKYPVDWLFNQDTYKFSTAKLYISYRDREWSLRDIAEHTFQSVESVHSRIRRHRKDPAKYPIDYIFSTKVRIGRPRKPSMFTTEPES